jgi:hypothetical protein
MMTRGNNHYSLSIKWWDVPCQGRQVKPPGHSRAGVTFLVSHVKFWRGLSTRASAVATTFNFHHFQESRLQKSSADMTKTKTPLPRWLRKCLMGLFIFISGCAVAGRRQCVQAAYLIITGTTNGEPGEDIVDIVFAWAEVVTKIFLSGSGCYTMLMWMGAPPAGKDTENTTLKSAQTSGQDDIGKAL